MTPLGHPDDEKWGAAVQTFGLSAKAMSHSTGVSAGIFRTSNIGRMIFLPNVCHHWRLYIVTTSHPENVKSPAIATGTSPASSSLAVPASAA
jgi:hypothetical protein